MGGKVLEYEMNKLVGIYNTEESFVKVIMITSLEYLKGIHTAVFCGHCIWIFSFKYYISIMDEMVDKLNALFSILRNVL